MLSDVKGEKSFDGWMDGGWGKVFPVNFMVASQLAPENPPPGAEKHFNGY